MWLDLSSLGSSGDGLLGMLRRSTDWTRSGFIISQSLTCLILLFSDFVHLLKSHFLKWSFVRFVFQIRAIYISVVETLINDVICTLHYFNANFI